MSACKIHEGDGAACPRGTGPPPLRALLLAWLALLGAGFLFGALAGALAAYGFFGDPLRGAALGALAGLGVGIMIALPDGTPQPSTVLHMIARGFGERWR